MFLFHKYNNFCAFLIISGVIPNLILIIFGILAPISEGLEKLSICE